MDPRIEEIAVSAYTVPTESVESDGTYTWDSTTLVLVEARSGNTTGLGYAYAGTSSARLIQEKLAGVVRGQEAMATGGCWGAMQRAVRNLGRSGVAATAMAAVDCALWDLKARLLGVSLLTLLGPVRSRVPVYASGGFTSYGVERLQEQFFGWVEEGITRMKMKVGSQPDEDVARVKAAREAIGPAGELFVDANGAYDRKQALEKAEAFAQHGVSWFEEPVSSDDLEGLRLLRDRVPAGMEIAAGEYGYDPFYFRRMLDAGAVDVLQADITRCGGVTGFLLAAALCEARPLPLSAHTAPSLHAAVCCALRPVRHVEYFYDHVRIEQMFFDGAMKAVDGQLAPDPVRPGFGLEFKRADAEPYRVAW